MHLKTVYTVSRKKGDTKLMPLTLSNLNPVFQLHGSQSMPGPSLDITTPLTLQKSWGTEGTDLGPLTSSQ